MQNRALLENLLRNCYITQRFMDYLKFCTAATPHPKVNHIRANYVGAKYVGANYIGITIQEFTIKANYTELNYVNIISDLYPI
jgi:hypothetical protein